MSIKKLHPLITTNSQQGEKIFFLTEGERKY